MANFRYSDIYGSDNTFAITRRQNVDTGTAVLVDLAAVTYHAELTLLVCTPSGSLTVACTDTVGFYCGDRLTVLVKNDESVAFGLGFVNSSGSPEIPSGSPDKEQVFEFIFDGALFMLTNYIIF